LLQDRSGCGGEPFHQLERDGRQGLLSPDHAGMNRNAAPERDLRRLDPGLLTDPPIFDAIAQTVIPEAKDYENVSPPTTKPRWNGQIKHRTQGIGEICRKPDPHRAVEETILLLSFGQVFVSKAVRQRRTASPGAGSFRFLLSFQHAPPPGGAFSCAAWRAKRIRLRGTRA